MIEEKVEEYLKRKRNSLLIEIEKISKRCEELEARDEKLYGEYKELKSQLESIEQTGIRGLFAKIFKTKKYEEVQRIKRQMDIIRNNILDISFERNEEEIRRNDYLLELENKEIEFEEEREHMKKDYKYAAKILLENDCEIASDAGFMSEVIDIDLFLISKDKSNNPELYKKYLKKLQNKLAGEENNEKEETIVLINSLLEEIDNPKVPEEGKYKIPHEYLFEAIRKNAEYCEKNGSTNVQSLLGKKNFGNNSVYSLKSYIDNDCKLPEKYGKKLEILYENEDFYIFQHKYTNKKLKNKMFRNGIKESAEEKRSLSAITTGNMDGSMCFTDLIDCKKGVSKIICAIPKKINKRNSHILLWGSDIKEGEAYLLPEYIIGNIDEQGEFQKNNYPRLDRKKYKMLFRNNEGKFIINSNPERNDKRFSDLESRL